MAEFDKVIPPGGRGNIRLQAKTEGYEGNFTKTARVYTNAPGKTVVTLKLKANIKALIFVSPRYVALFGKEGESITRVVKIKAGLSKPLTLSSIQFNLGEKLTYRIVETEKGKRFQIHFKSLPHPAQTYSGYLKIKTNYAEKPELTIRIRGGFVKKGKKSRPDPTTN